MAGDETANLRVTRLTPLLPPTCVFEELPGSLDIYKTVVDARAALLSTMAGQSERLLCVVTLPPSCNDTSSLLTNAEQLAELSAKVSDDLLLVFQPPAGAYLQGLTTLSSAVPSEGITGAQINAQIKEARELLLHVNRLGLPTALEFGDTITPQFFCDLLAWAAVSAQSATLRELVSGLSMPVGLSAPASSDAWVLKAIELSARAHHFLGVSAEGVCGIVESSGNPDVVAMVTSSQADGKALCAAIERLHRARPATALMAECAAEECAQLLPMLSGRELGGRVIGLRVTLAATADGLAPGSEDTLRMLAAAVHARRKAARPPPAHAAADEAETHNLRVVAVRPLLPPACLQEDLPRLAQHAAVVQKARASLQAALVPASPSDRFIILAGPAAVDDVGAATEYAARLAVLAKDKEVCDDVQLVMSVRLGSTDGGWPGLLMDPSRDGSCHINEGVKLARKLLLTINSLGLPAACEFGDTITPQFFADLVAFASVSAQSATLRELVSGLSMPVGLRSPSAPDGSAEDPATALAAAQAAALPRPFLGVTAHGTAGIVLSTGNPDCSVVMGGGTGSAEQRAAAIVGECGKLRASVIAECGGGMEPSQQAEMAAALLCAVSSGGPAPRGLSLNSYLLTGAVAEDGQPVHGMSVTAPCMDWVATEHVIRAAARAARERRQAAAPKKRARSE
ncbi:hypothetical protein AB1Y20_003649 [Prymnesium parvum]|uniref:3-deoxy-7-phosphoheptulonate synthase n=1 Tax=Prymnesium parvum TaxID=97485 RepID=A0AB34J4H6_PRYPA